MFRRNVFFFQLAASSLSFIGNNNNNSAQARWAAAEAEHLARFRSKFHLQRAELEKDATKTARTLAAPHTMYGKLQNTASQLIELRDAYRETQSRAIFLEAKTIISSLPKYILDDDPALSASLKIIRVAAYFSFDPLAERSLVDIIDLVKRSAYAFEAHRAIQFLSVLQTFQPRPDDDIRAIMENVADGIRMGSTDLLVHEVATLLSALAKLDREVPVQKRARYTNRPLLEALTRHLVTFHSTAPINDVCRAAAFLTKVSGPHGRVLLHEMQSRVTKEANNLTVPPVAALDLISAYGTLEPEGGVGGADAHSNQPAVVEFARNFDLDADVAAPVSLSLTTRPVSRRVMLATACEALLTHVDLLTEDDVADALLSLRVANYAHSELLERLASRAMKINAAQKADGGSGGGGRRGGGASSSSSSLFSQEPQQQQQSHDPTLRVSNNTLSIIRIMDGLNFFKVRDLGPLFESYATRIDQLATQMRRRNTTSTATTSSQADKLPLHNCVEIIGAFADAGDDARATVMLQHIAEVMVLIPQAVMSNRKRVGDALLVRALQNMSRVRLHTTPAGVKAVDKVVRELFVVRGGLAETSQGLIEATETAVEAMLPQAEKDPALLKAIRPIVSE